MSGGQASRITSGDFTVASYRVSVDGRRIAHQRAPSPLFGEADRGEVWVMDSAGGGAVALTQNTVSESGAELSPDGSTVLFVAAANASFAPYYNDKIFLAPATGGAIRMLAPEFPYELERATWSKDGRAIHFTANTGVRSQLFTVSAAGGTPEPLTKGDHSSRAGSSAPPRTGTSFVRDQVTNPGDVWMVSGPGAAASMTRVTRVHERLATTFALPRVEAITWKGADGMTVEGLLYYPLGYTKGQRHPLVVQTHGGPAASDKFAFGSGSELHPGPDGDGLRGPEAELPRQHRLRRSVPAGHGRQLLQERAPRRDGRR